jgi:uncharacterized protein (DUF1810 family)
VSNSFNLERFKSAQDLVYHKVVAELSGGRKHSHWVWFIFPQIAGLASSTTAKTYAISSLEEANAFLADPLLGGRYRECCQLLLTIDNKPIESIMAHPDNLKLCSSITLFKQCQPSDPLFVKILERFYDGRADEITLTILKRLSVNSSTD